MAIYDLAFGTRYSEHVYPLFAFLIYPDTYPAGISAIFTSLIYPETGMDATTMITRGPIAIIYYAALINKYDIVVFDPHTDRTIVINAYSAIATAFYISFIDYFAFLSESYLPLSLSDRGFVFGLCVGLYHWCS